MEKNILKIKGLSRLEHDDTVIYIDPEYPEWFAVNKSGDNLLKTIISGKSITTDSVYDEINKIKFIKNFSYTEKNSYSGRADFLKLTHLDECWLHITDNCNLKCSHCLFSCSSEKKSSLDLKSIKDCVDQTYRLGTKVFYLTGGEPLVHENICEIMQYILAFDDTFVTVMTNGVLVPKFADFFRKLPLNRIFFQVSVDGTEETHDKIRGKGSFKRLLKALEELEKLNTRNTISMVVNNENLDQMKEIIDLGEKYKVSSIHYMWLLVTGSAKPEIFSNPEKIFENFKKACIYAKKKGIEIDNLKNISSRVFSPPGTRYDLGNAGWRSIAIGPDKNIYPSAALTGVEELNCGNISDGIENIWKNSQILKNIRNETVLNIDKYKDSLLKYISGGDDLDHSYYSKKTFAGNDPYFPLYEKIILWVISENTKDLPEPSYPAVILKMGDKLLQCKSEGDGVSLTHSNCVLTFSNIRSTVGDFYTKADSSENTDILNPVCYSEEEISHIPKHSRIKSYGCGSPVLDSDIKEGETIADLGCGAGVECFIASKKTGKNGRVFGVDMLDHMLEKANASNEKVSQNLGYKNVEFKKGFLEKIPLNDNETDLITSNCVINLSEDKTKTFLEILRVLKPGGRIVVSDVVTDFPSPAFIQNDPKLQGECIAGAMVQSRLFSVLELAGFTDISIIKRFFYRSVKNHRFFSLTYKAYKPLEKTTAKAVYPGPHAAVITEKGQILLRGEQYELSEPLFSDSAFPHILILDGQGNAVNIDSDNSCCCSSDALSNDCSCFEPKPEAAPQKTNQTSLKHRSGCIVCGEEIEYLKTNETMTCFYCSKEFSSNSLCKNKHFVCDFCHGSDVLSFVKELLINTKETDMIVLMNKIRSHPCFNIHGPEHHFTIPGIITAVYRNLGGDISDSDILTAIERGSSIPGGSCAFWGGCGAPLGAGIGFGIILGSTPLKPAPRQTVQKIVSEITGEISKIKAARCCQRESWLTLLNSSRLSEKYLDIKLPALGSIVCTQMNQNLECVKGACPFYEK
ncbi:MAG: DUF5714 domain-containing protein [Desulfobacteraceae bacterium]